MEDESELERSTAAAHAELQMAAETAKQMALEIGHVLFVDIVSYSQLSINEQHAAIAELTQTVRSTEQFRKAAAADRLIKIATGDGMALVFYTSPEAPVRCAMEISGALKQHPRLHIRMGIHSGPVSSVTDVTGQTNLAGAGLNLAQRVMECGEAGHILLSKHVAEDMSEFEQWRLLLHDLGTCEVKHGLRIAVVNLWSDDVGNRQAPQKFRALRKRRRVRWAEAAAALLLSAAIAAAFVVVSRKSSTAISPVSNKSVAVLPFENLTKDEENASFAGGVQDEILTDLAKIADLKVISRTSVMQYKSGSQRNLREIAKALGVSHVVEGSVQRAGERVRVSAQLIDARTDMHLWAERYDRDLADVFAIQSEIAKTIADQLQAKISPSEKAAIEKAPTTDLVAYDLYLRAQALFADTSDAVHAREKLPQAAQMLDEALTRDPNFLQAWCLLSRVHSVAYFRGHDHTPARLDLAKAALERAMRLQPDAGEVHLALANYYYHGFRDYKRASSELAIARRTLPNDAEVFLYTGLIDRRQGHWNEATRNMERALELDPRNLFTLQQLALTYQTQHHYTDAARTYDRALTIVPADPNTHILRALVALDWRADIKPFQATLATLVAENPSVAADVDLPRYALSGRPAAAATPTPTNR